MESKLCPRCKVSKPLTEFWIRRDRNVPASRCKPCSADAQREWRRTQPEYDRKRYQAVKVETRERHLVRKYGVSLADYDAMLAAQNGRCAICLTAEDTQRYGVFHVDHCHATGKVRGLLCRGCNNVLGVVSDNPDALARAIAHLGVTVPQIPELIGRAILAAERQATSTTPGFDPLSDPERTSSLSAASLPFPRSTLGRREGVSDTPAHFCLTPVHAADSTPQRRRDHA